MDKFYILFRENWSFSTQSDQSCRSFYSLDVALQLGIGDIRCKLGSTKIQSYFMIFLRNMVVFRRQHL